MPLPSLNVCNNRMESDGMAEETTALFVCEGRKEAVGILRNGCHKYVLRISLECEKQTMNAILLGLSDERKLLPIHTNRHEL